MVQYLNIWRSCSCLTTPPPAERWEKAFNISFSLTQWDFPGIINDWLEVDRTQKHVAWLCSASQWWISKCMVEISDCLHNRKIRSAMQNTKEHTASLTRLTSQARITKPSEGHLAQSRYKQRPPKWSVQVQLLAVLPVWEESVIAATSQRSTVLTVVTY